MKEEKRIITIRLRDLRFHSRIGVFEQERTVGNEFLVNVSIEIDGKNFRTEQLDTTLSYADIYDEIAGTMKREWLLLESAAEEICRRISGRWEQVKCVDIKIIKLAPPISGIDGDCGIEYFFEKKS